VTPTYKKVAELAAARDAPNKKIATGEALFDGRRSAKEDLQPGPVHTGHDVFGVHKMPPSCDGQDGS
jgi:hypothetical protein